MHALGRGPGFANCAGSQRMPNRRDAEVSLDGLRTAREHTLLRLSLLLPPLCAGISAVSAPTPEALSLLPEPGLHLQLTYLLFAAAIAAAALTRCPLCRRLSSCAARKLDISTNSAFLTESDETTGDIQTRATA